jgi:hypothetical protein
MTAVERYERVGNELRMEITLYDPVAFVQPLHAKITYTRAAGDTRPVFSTCTDTNGPSSNIFTDANGITNEKVKGDPGYWNPNDARPWATHYAIGEKLQSQRR